MGVAHLTPADRGQPESRGEDGLPTEGPVNKGRPDRAVGGAEGAESLREEDGLWMTLTTRAALWRCTTQPRVVAPAPALLHRDEGRGRSASGQACGRAGRISSDVRQRRQRQRHHPSPQPQDPDDQRFSVSPQPHARQLWQWMRRAVQQPAQQPSLQRDPTGAQCGGHGEAAASLADPRGTHPVAGPCSEIPCGIANLGNTCFLSSLLQCMAALDPIRALANSPGGGPLERALRDTLTMVGRGGAATVRPDRLWTCLLAAQPSYADHGQQDLLECFRLLLGHSELAGAVESSRVGQIKCEEESGGCGFTSLDTDRVTTWNVTVPVEGPPP